MPNIVNFPAQAYSGGAVVFDNSAFLNFYSRLQARQQAKQQAVDNYYQDLGKGLTPAGMAANDVDDFTGKVGAWRDFVTKNRNVLSDPRSKDYSKAVTQANYLYNDALQLSAASKSKVKDIADTRQFIKPDHPLTDGSLLMMHEGSLPITKGYKPIDLSSLQYQPKDDPATAEDWTKWGNYAWNGLQMDEGQPSIQILPDKKSKVVTTVSSYSPQAINMAHDRAVQLYHTDPKFYNSVNELAKDPAQFEKMNAAFKEIYGRDMDIQHPEEFGAALLLRPIKKTNTQPYAYSPTTIKIDNSADKAKAKQGWVMDLADAANSGDPVQIQNVASQLFAGNQQYAKLDRTHIENGNLYFDYKENEFDPNIGEKDPKTGKPKGDWVWKKKVFFTPLNTLDQPQTRAKMAAFQQKMFGSTAKAEGTPYYKQETNTKPSAQSKTYKINNKEWTQEQIEKGAKHYNMTVDEYLKQLGYK